MPRARGVALEVAERLCGVRARSQRGPQARMQAADEPESGEVPGGVFAVSQGGCGRV